MATAIPNLQADLLARLLAKHGSRREQLLAILQDWVQDQGWLSPQAIHNIAQALDISSAEVYGTASFYSFLPTKPLGQNVIHLCKNISCYMEGKDDIARAIEKEIGCKLGETSADAQFTFLETNCLGWCHMGPVMLLNNLPHTELTAESAVKAICELKSKGACDE